MRMNKLAPWNWFNKEEDHSDAGLPVRQDRSERYPSSPIRRIHREIDRILEDFFDGFGFPDSAEGGSGGLMSRSGMFKPNVDISATEKEYSIAVELPGVDEKNVQLELVNDTLHIKGEKSQESERKEKNYHCVERSYGSFRRVLTLPEDVDRDGIQATCKNGVMTISIPRKPGLKANSKQIEIKAG